MYSTKMLEKRIEARTTTPKDSDTSPGHESIYETLEPSHMWSDISLYQPIQKQLHVGEESGAKPGEPRYITGVCTSNIHFIHSLHCGCSDFIIPYLT